MNESVSSIKRLAFVLMTLAARILPPSGKGWAKAMLTEFYYLEQDSSALLWAIGCVIASIKMRYEAMNIGDLKISRWILIPELLLCFVPLTFYWLEVSFGAYGIFRHNMEFIWQSLSSPPSAMRVMILTTAVLGLVGPAGLVAAFQLIVLKHPIHTRMGGIILITGPVVLGIVSVICLLLMRPVIWLDELGLVLLLFTILPAAGAAHLYYGYTPSQE